VNVPAFAAHRHARSLARERRAAMDAEMARRIRDLHIATVSWWGCVVRLTCLTCRTSHPCGPRVSLDARLLPDRPQPAG
jgi:hypothetical protein